MQDKITRICLWSGPRNISTTLMYSFAQRSDTQVYDEPLYAFYLKNTKASEYHPGAEDVLKAQENDGNKVVEMMLGNHDKPVVFFKNMTHHLLDLDKTFLKNVVNVILTRDPKEMIPSFDKVIENPSINDIGYADHTDLVKYFEKEDIPYIVLDSKNVLLNPEKILTEFCQRADIPFEKSMLSWKTGARSEDGVWAKYWYSNIHKSNGFMEYKPKTEEFPKHLNELLHECKPHYERLKKVALK
jgi:hypothetical protein